MSAYDEMTNALRLEAALKEAGYSSEEIDPTRFAYATDNSWVFVHYGANDTYTVSVFYKPSCMEVGKLGPVVQAGIPLLTEANRIARMYVHRQERDA